MEQKIGPMIDKFNIRDSLTPFLRGTGIESRKEEEECVSMEYQKIYRSTVGALLYLTKHSRPDLYKSIRELSKANKVDTLGHLVCLLRVCKWLFKNKNLGIKLKKWDDMECNWRLEAYSYSDWENCKDTRKSVTGYIVFINENPISWGSRGKKWYHWHQHMLNIQL